MKSGSLGSFFDGYVATVREMVEISLEFSASPTLREIGRSIEARLSALCLVVAPVLFLFGLMFLVFLFSAVSWEHALLMLGSATAGTLLGLAVFGAGFALARHIKVSRR
jgi:hypothetical protein